MFTNSYHPLFSQRSGSGLKSHIFFYYNYQITLNNTIYKYLNDFLFINNTLISKINVVEFIESQLHSFKK